MTGKEKIIKKFPELKDLSFWGFSRYCHTYKIILCHYCANYREYAGTSCMDDGRKTCSGGYTKYLKSEVKE